MQPPMSSTDINPHQKADDNMLRVTSKKKSAYLKTLSKRWVGGQGLFKKILMNLFLILCGGNSLFNNEDTTYF